MFALIVLSYLLFFPVYFHRFVFFVFIFFNGSYIYNSCTDTSSFKENLIMLSCGCRDSTCTLILFNLEGVSFRGCEYKVNFSFKCC